MIIRDKKSKPQNNRKPSHIPQRQFPPPFFPSPPSLRSEKMSHERIWLLIQVIMHLPYIFPLTYYILQVYTRPLPSSTGTGITLSNSINVDVNPVIPTILIIPPD